MRTYHVEMPRIDIHRQETVSTDGQGQPVVLVTHEPVLVFRAVIEEDGVQFGEELAVRHPYQLTGDYGDSRSILDVPEDERREMEARWLGQREKALDELLADADFAAKWAKVKAIRASFTDVQASEAPKKPIQPKKV